MRTLMTLAGLSLALLVLSPSNAANNANQVQDQNDVGPSAMAKIPASDATLQTALEGDVNHDGIVNVADILALLENWGACKNAAFSTSAEADVSDQISCDGDLNSDSTINQLDLLIVLNAWK